MGITSSALSGTATLDSFIGELSDVAFERSLSSSRFLKCVRGKHADGQVVVKLFIKAGSINLSKILKQQELEKSVLLSVPNALSYQRIHETDRAVYLIRQYIASNLYDRVSTRPFLESIEKRWIVFQLLICLRDCHARGIKHGDIKTENVLVTSWNWAYLTDFAFFKPTYLPENNPADFSYFFDTSFRRTCYVAPERFYSSAAVQKGELTVAMDIFSLGCVIAELFLDGSPLFDLSQLFKYKAGEYDPMLLLDKIEDIEVRSLIGHMINLDPEKRYTAEGYLQKWQRRAFPHYFGTFLHEYISLVTDPQRHHVQKPSWDIDDTLERIFFEFDKISFFLKFDDTEGKSESTDDLSLKGTSLTSIPNYHRSAAVSHKRTSAEDGALVFLSILLSGVRNSSKSTTRVRTCDTILALSDRISDEAKLDRVVPYLMALVSDEAPDVRVSALGSLTQVLASVQILTPVNAFVFPEYILKKLREHVLASTVLVRVKYAQCISTLVKTAIRFADMAYALCQEGFLTLIDPTETEPGSHTDQRFESHLESGKRDQETIFRQHILALLSDSESIVKRALLPSIAELCVFFGPHRANDLILGHLITYLNDRDWLLKAALFDHIVSLGQYLGRQSVETYIVPLMVQAMIDMEDFVLEKVLNTLTGLCRNGLISRPICVNLVAIVVRFLLHPNLWVREAVTGYIMAACQDLTSADIYCIIYPLVRPFLRMELMNLSAAAILQSLRRPLTTPILEAAFKWARDSSMTDVHFWNSGPKQSEFSGDLAAIDSSQVAATFSRLLSSTPSKDGRRVPSSEKFSSLTTEDEFALAKLRTAGLRAEDDGKLLALREFVWRAAIREKESMLSVSEEISVVPIVPTATTIFFDTLQQERVKATSDRIDLTSDVHTVLQEASRKASITKAKMIVQRDAELTPSAPHIPLSSTSTSTPLTVMNSTVDSDLVKQAQQSTAADGQATGDMPPLQPDLLLRTSRVSSINEDRKSSSSRQTNAVNLTGIGTKASAEVGTTNTVALGQINHRSLLDSRHGMKQTKSSAQQRLPNHDYHGFDQTVLHALEKVYASNYAEAMDLFEGPVLSRPTPPVIKSDQAWRPGNTLVAHVQEHTAAINCVKVSPDSLFFLTCSDDGTVKVWDSAKLEKNVANRARLTYRGLAGSKVKALCFLQNSHCFAAASDQGQIHVVKVECEAPKPGTSKYGSIIFLRKFEFDEGENVSAMKHIVANQISTLMVTTNKARILAIELRTMTVLYTLQNPAHHGLLTCFCIDSRNAWLLVGTSRGILDLWDLRFQLRLKSIGMPFSRSVNQIFVHPSRGRNRWVCVATAGTPEVTVWDIEKSMCRERFRPANCPIEMDNQPYQAWDVEESSPEALMARFNQETYLHAGEARTSHIACRALIVAGEKPADEQNRSVGLSFIAASTDLTIRRWDLHKIEHSGIVSRPEHDGEKPAYQAISSSTTEFYEEVQPKSPHSSKKRSTLSSPGSVQQNQLLRAHKDTILDMAYLQWPYKMIISVDRSGVLKVFA